MRRVEKDVEDTTLGKEALPRFLLRSCSDLVSFNTVREELKYKFCLSTYTSSPSAFVLLTRIIDRVGKKPFNIFYFLLNESHK